MPRFELVDEIVKCPCCPNRFNPTHLRNESSKKEYEISGLCQKCQDSVFGRD